MNPGSKDPGFFAICHWGRCFLAFSLKYNVDTSVDIKVERKLYDKVSFDLNV